jgi:hypothetical protein
MNGPRRVAWPFLPRIKPIVVELQAFAQRQRPLQPVYAGLVSLHHRRLRPVLLVQPVPRVVNRVALVAGRPIVGDADANGLAAPGCSHPRLCVGCTSPCYGISSPPFTSTTCPVT